MPLYEYSCQSCEQRFEVLQKLGAGATAVRCPECGGSRLERQHSTFAGTVQQTASAQACPCGSPARCGPS